MTCNTLFIDQAICLLDRPFDGSGMGLIRNRGYGRRRFDAYSFGDKTDNWHLWSAYRRYDRISESVEEVSRELVQNSQMLTRVVGPLFSLLLSCHVCGKNCVHSTVR